MSDIDVKSTSPPVVTPPPGWMNPEIKSLLTSYLSNAFSGVALLAAGAGVISAKQEAGLTDILTSSAVFLIGAAGTWLVNKWKSRQHSATAEIAAVNNRPNGVKVVSEASPAPTVTAPLKGPSA